MDTSATSGGRLNAVTGLSCRASTEQRAVITAPMRLQSDSISVILSGIAASAEIIKAGGARVRMDRTTVFAVRNITTIVLLILPKNQQTKERESR